jgi:tetratricopeptide (TPR) repeat protein
MIRTWTWARTWTCAIGLFVGGCAGHGREAEVPKLPPAKPEAVDALKDAARLQRLGPGNFDRALERLKAAEELDDRLWEAFYDEGWLELERHHADAAVTALEHAIGIVPNHLPTALLLGRAYTALGRPGDAARVYRGLIDRKLPAADAVQARIALAAAYRRADKLQEATDTLRDALKIEPRSMAALNGLGLVYEAKGQHELAELVLRRAIEVDEKSKAAAESWNNLGLVALKRRRDQEAFADFDQAARLDPTMSVARRNKAVVYLDCGDYARAAEELKQVTRADPSDAEAWIALGVAERGRGQLDAAEKAFEHALEVEGQPAPPTAPTTLDAEFDLAVLFQDFKKDASRAREHLTAFLKNAPAKHPKMKDAEARMKELAPKPSPEGQSKAGGPS